MSCTLQPAVSNMSKIHFESNSQLKGCHCIIIKKCLTLCHHPAGGNPPGPLRMGGEGMEAVTAFAGEILTKATNYWLLLLYMSIPIRYLNRGSSASSRGGLLLAICQRYILKAIHNDYYFRL